MAEPEQDRAELSPPRQGSAKGDSPPSWGVPDAVICWLAGMVGGLISVSIVLSVTGHEEFDQFSLGEFALSQSGMWAALIVAVWLVARFRGNGMVADFGLRIRPIDAVVGVVAGFLAQMMVNLLYLPVIHWTSVTEDDVSQAARELTDRAEGAVSIVLLVVIVGLAAPLVEEIFYRGLLQRSLQRRLGPTAGLLVASLLFALVHGQPLLIPGLFFAGLIFGLLAHRTGRLGPAIVAHTAFNMTAVAALVGEAQTT